MKIRKIMTGLGNFFVIVIAPALVLLAFAFPTVAETTIDRLDVDPQRCIALNEGQVCYQSIEFKWQAKKKGKYCIVSIPDMAIIHCWKNQISGSFGYDFSSRSSQKFALLNAEYKQIADATVVVAWVYKKQIQRKSTWRLF